jgi:hypothetical protein
MGPKADLGVVEKKHISDATAFEPPVPTKYYTFYVT